MTLENKNAVLYGVGESLGGAVARTLAEAGAKVFLTARRLENARKVADEIRAAGGQAEADVSPIACFMTLLPHCGRAYVVTNKLIRFGRLPCRSPRRDVPRSCQLRQHRCKCA
jgi:NAD(P)-dependent dehydrogenase (short-subunit alcohol dehydrogenase family)